MGVQSATLLVGSTVSATGGTSQTFTPDGVFIPNGVHLADANQASYKIRENLVLKTRNPQLSGNVYGKGKRWATLTVPKELVNGTITFNLIRIEVEVHPEMSASDYADMLKKGAQLLIDADFTAFWSTGSLA